MKIACSRSGNILNNMAEAWLTLRLVSFLITVVFLVVVAYLARQIIILRQKEEAELKQLLRATAEAAKPVNPRWEQILVQFNSTQPNDWKQAIIEADAILDELVAKIQPRGETLGERLKQIEESDFKTLDQAWSAHKLRNRIAHGDGAVLAEREARQALADYRAVFEEFGIV